MKSLKVIILTALAALAPGMNAQELSPLSKAMLDGYGQLLAANPQDYITLHQRATQYFQLGMTADALADINAAIQFTPENEKDELGEQFSLLADILSAQSDFEGALKAVDQALANEQMPYFLNQKGDILLALNRPDQAVMAFSALQRLNSRSQEAMFGLAKAAVMQGKKDDARELMKHAEALNPTSYLTYCYLGDLERQLGENQAAAADYLSAFSLTSNAQRPLRSLLELAEQDYDAVSSAASYALTKTSNKVPLHFLKGNAALRTGHLNDAYESYRHLASITKDEDAGVYITLAEICLKMERPDEASNYVGKALYIDPANAEALSLRDKIKEAK